MNRQITEQSEFIGLHRLMLDTYFPETPIYYSEIKEVFDKCQCFGLYNKEGILTDALIYSDFDNYGASVDIISSIYTDKNSPSSEFIDWVFDNTFNILGSRYVWCNPKSPEMLKLICDLGFSLVVGINSEVPCFVLTEQNIKRMAA